MPKLIIDYDSGMPLDTAIRFVKTVISSERVSRSRGVEKFCHLSIIKEGGKKYEVYARDRKPPHYPDSFIVREVNAKNR